MEQLLINLISGVAGSNVVGAFMKNKNLGALVNSLAGIAGGSMGGQVLKLLKPANESMLYTIASGAIGGVVVMVIVYVINYMMLKKAS